jgi:hypothetical protein
LENRRAYGKDEKRQTPGNSEYVTGRMMRKRALLKCDTDKSRKEHPKLTGRVGEDQEED